MNDEHAEGRALFQKYLAKQARLNQVRAWTQEVLRATSGASMTPVRPLATMGKNGGPLVCDACGKSMILEGGGYQGRYVADVWPTIEDPRPDWRSYISGGMTMVTEINGTLRVHHGYAGSACGKVVDEQLDRVTAEHRARRDSEGDGSEELTLIEMYLRAEHPELAPDLDSLLNRIYGVLFGRDPGLGVNAPEPEGAE